MDITKNEGFTIISEVKKGQWEALKNFILNEDEEGDKILFQYNATIPLNAHLGGSKLLIPVEAIGCTESESPFNVWIAYVQEPGHLHLIIDTDVITEYLLDPDEGVITYLDLVPLPVAQFIRELNEAWQED